MESNRVDLDPTVKDRFGLPVPRVTHRQHPNDLAMKKKKKKKIYSMV